MIPGTHFRTGCTSYVIPADILPNVLYMAGKIDDMEIVLFESEEISNLPSAATIYDINAIARDNNLSFTIHLPTDLKAVSNEPAMREKFIAQAARIADRFSQLDPFAWIVHLEGHNDFSSQSGIDDFTAKSIDTIHQLTKATGVHADQFAIENLSYPWQSHLAILDKSECSQCADIGHLTMTNSPLDEALTALMPKTRVIHLHGIHEKKDHRSLSWMKSDAAFVTTLKKHLTDFTGVCTLEVFEESDTFSSLQTLTEIFA